MCPPLEQHVSPLNQSLLHELIAALGSLTWLASTSQEYTSFFVLDRHEVGRYLDVHNVGPVTMRPEVVHEQVMSIVDEEMKGVKHLLVIPDQRHLQILIHHLFEFAFGLVFLVDELDLSLLI